MKIKNHNNIVWACYKKCPGQLKINIEDEMIDDDAIKAHDHPQLSTSELRVVLARESIYEAVMNSRKTSNQAITMASQFLDDSERIMLKNPSIIKQTINNRLKKITSYELPPVYVIPDVLTKTYSDTDFYNMILFSMKQID